MSESASTSSDSLEQSQEPSEADVAGGAYEQIRSRLAQQGEQLASLVASLNQRRLEEFGNKEMAIAGRLRYRTENNCVPRDMVQVADMVLFGFNVKLGLKKETQLEDVFALLKVDKKSESDYAFEEAAIAGSFLDQPRFRDDFTELYKFYKHTRLDQIRKTNGLLLLSFQIGEKLEDKRVFKFSCSADEKDIAYIDNRGERDIELPPKYDFEWTASKREDVVNGAHPHLNILDTIFIECIGGDFTVKIENNTDEGRGIYQEAVEDQTQSIDDAEISYALLGDLILLRVLPYREKAERFFVYNKLTEQIQRVDNIGGSCVQLPNDHGIIFPGGIFLQTGEMKSFELGDIPVNRFLFKRKVSSPNGEDVLFIFYEPMTGTIALLAYNMIEKALLNPLVGHGYALEDSGQLLLMHAKEEATRVHPLQLWETPFYSDEYALNQPESTSILGKIGNAELVRGISSLFSITRLIDNQSVSAHLYQELGQTARRVFDEHYWISDPDFSDTANLLNEVLSSSELAVDEFEKVRAIRKRTEMQLREAEQANKALISRIRTESREDIKDYVAVLDEIRSQRGRLVGFKDLRYTDLTKIEEMDKVLVEQQEEFNQLTVTHLQSEDAFTAYIKLLQQSESQLDAADTNKALAPVLQSIDDATAGLDLLMELMSTLAIDDAVEKTRLIDEISTFYGKFNQLKARSTHKRKSLGSKEASAQFASQFKLFSQSVTNALALADTPEKADDQMSRLLVRLEKIESEFGEYEDFLPEVIEKRDEIYESFDLHKQRLIDEQQKRAASIFAAAERIVATLERRAQKTTTIDELNTLFASDPLLLKIHDLCENLRSLDAQLKAEDILARLKALKDQAVRAQRDKSEVFEDGGKIIKLGPRHRFAVSQQEVKLTLLPKDNLMQAHLIGTQYYETLQEAAYPELYDLKPFWNSSLPSESHSLYRSEYLAVLILRNARDHRDHAQNGESDQPVVRSMDELRRLLLEQDGLEKYVSDFAAPRYQEGYEKGIHDHDAAAILRSLIPLIDNLGLQRYAPEVRSLAALFYEFGAQESLRIQIRERALSAGYLQKSVGSEKAFILLSEDLQAELDQFIDYTGLKHLAGKSQAAAAYLARELSEQTISFTQSSFRSTILSEAKVKVSSQAWEHLVDYVKMKNTYDSGSESSFSSVTSSANTQIQEIEQGSELSLLGDKWRLVEQWLLEILGKQQQTELQRYIPEAIAFLLSEKNRYSTAASGVSFTVENMMGSHPRVKDRVLSIAVDDLLERYDQHINQYVPRLSRYQELRRSVLKQKEHELTIESFIAKPLSSFIRNKLITEAYLPLIGDNFAKQMGAAGESKRSDLMGLLMMISPPGYGKTTLMEYLADRLGLIFMKINCPSLGHEVTSLDPAKAPHATAKQELEKLNLSFQMGNNVMLYLDDIQHTHPEFLQKFISLCDGTRRIEGVWKGEPVTYDMRAKKFAVVMAGNPYTESGEVFKIPDMLANRADIYNLGDILGGKERVFALSYIENCLTSNSVLAPLALRDLKDVYRFVDLAEGNTAADTAFSYDYSQAEITEIVAVLKNLFLVRDIVLKVNQQYIYSAAQDDRYRQEPAFKLQGSYRNMNKMAEKISAVSNKAEIMQIVANHYLGEAQMLTTGAEENLLKLAELRGNMTDEQSARFTEIKAAFLKTQAGGGKDASDGQRIATQLYEVSKDLNKLSQSAELIAAASHDEHAMSDAELALAAMDKMNTALQASLSKVSIVNEPVPGVDVILKAIAASLDNSIYPLVRSMEKKLDIDLHIHDRLSEMSDQLRDVEQRYLKQSSTKPSLKKR